MKNHWNLKRVSQRFYPPAPLGIWSTLTGIIESLGDTPTLDISQKKINFTNCLNSITKPIKFMPNCKIVKFAKSYFLLKFLIVQLKHF